MGWGKSRVEGCLKEIDKNIKREGKSLENLFHICLRAVSEDRRIDREYVLEMGVDLFRHWYVTTTYGRFLTKGRKATFDFKTKEEAYVFMHATLKRRLSAPKRVGYPYCITSLQMPQTDKYEEEWLNQSFLVELGGSLVTATKSI